MSTSGQAVRIHAADAALSGELTVPRGARSLVVFVTGGCGGTRSARETAIADVLHDRGIGTCVVDLVGAGEPPSRGRRLNVDLLADRLRGVLAWARAREATASLEIGFYGVDTGATAVLQEVSSPDASGTAAVLVNGRVDLSDGDHVGVSLPLLFVVDGGHDHLRSHTRQVYTEVGTAAGEKNVLWTEREADVVHVTAGWFELHLPSPWSDTAGRAGQRGLAHRHAPGRRPSGSGE